MTQALRPASTHHPNADAAELDRFNRLAARWWDENSEFRPLHRINPHRLQWINDLVGLRNRQVLDVGCGGGILAESMARQGATVTGIDLAEWPLRIATQHAAGNGLALHYAHSSAEDWCARHAQSYDLVTCMEMLEHVPQPAAVVEACARLVRPGGWVFFSTLNRNPLSYLVAILGAEYMLRILPRGTHQYRRFIKPVELEAMAARQGLVPRERKGLRYNPLSQRFKLAGAGWVGYLLAFQRGAPASEAFAQT
ncbi:MAG: bifunctional 2-polyprenyl-6-hydroxyphenol methylase/3-demethylubiquinol 3-O-methyltransferase UbiG [Inhella sp.]